MWLYVGWGYGEGVGAMQDDAEAARWYAPEAAQGHAQSRHVGKQNPLWSCSDCFRDVYDAKC